MKRRNRKGKGNIKLNTGKYKELENMMMRDREKKNKGYNQRYLISESNAIFSFKKKVKNYEYFLIPNKDINKIRDYKGENKVRKYETWRRYNLALFETNFAQRTGATPRI